MEGGSESGSTSPFKSDILKGKVALLTEGASGIGFEIALQYGKHGSSVAVMSRRKSAIDSAVSTLHSHGIQAVGFEGDVCNQEDARRVVESTVEYFGKLDILVNAAAGNFHLSPMDLSHNLFRTVLDIDAAGTFAMHLEAIKNLKSGGMILNISPTSLYTAAWHQIPVSATKADMDSLTRSMALEWGTDYGIRVNGISPGPISDTTGMSKHSAEEIEVGENWDIAMSALYLASDAGKCINGTTIVVDGGQSLSGHSHVQKEGVRQLSRRSRNKPAGPWPTPTSEL